MSKRIIYEPLKQLGRELFWSNNGLYELVAKVRGEKVLCCDPRPFDLYISGFPRSGNHFYASAVKVMTAGRVQTNPVNHYPPYSRKALLLSKPTVLLIRNPVDACASWSTFAGVSVQHSLSFYLQFHRLIGDTKKESFVAVFEDFIKDPSTSLKDLAELYSLPVEVDWSDDLKAEITAQIPRWKDKNKSPNPTVERKKQNEENKSLLLRKENESLLNKAREVYFKLTEK